MGRKNGDEMKAEAAILSLQLQAYAAASCHPLSPHKIVLRHLSKFVDGICLQVGTAHCVHVNIMANEIVPRGLSFNFLLER